MDGLAATEAILATYRVYAVVYAHVNGLVPQPRH